MLYRTNLNDISITGRFGNQLWAIASTLGIAKKNTTYCYFPPWDYQAYFPNPLPQMDIDVFKGYKIYTEESPYYSDVWLDPRNDWDLKGYFQSYKYFENCKERINFYLFTDVFGSNKVDYNTCAVHVRRGDYLNLQNIHPVHSKNYFEKAMNYFPKNTYFKFFSDDINWCIENFRYFSPGYIEFAQIGDTVIDWAEMTNRFRHIIISNSSYSWWSAYLKPFDDKIIIAPKVWVLNENKDDRVPEEWIRL